MIKKITCLIMSAVMLCLTGCDSSYSSGSSSDDDHVTFLKGTYNFYNKQEAKYLSFIDTSLILSSTPATWKVERASVGFYLYAGDNDVVLDIDNAKVATGTIIKLWEVNGYNVQKWKIIMNENGTYTFLSCADENYCLGIEGGRTVLQLRDKTNATQEWQGTAVVDNTLQQYKAYTSNQGIVEVRLPYNITDVISDSRLQQWANDLEKAYFSLYDLTNFKPYDYIRIEAYKPITRYSNVLGYVLDDVNIIYIDGDFIVKDLAKMANRVNDWNFCVLHELGHMFDCQRPWNFESEALTDIKLSYILEQNYAGAELSHTGNTEVRYGKDIMYSYQAMSGNLSEEYDIFAFAYKFLQIKEEIGWEPIKQAFHKLQSEEDKYVNVSKVEKFELFINTISDYSGKNIKSYFTTAEWNSIMTKVSIN